MQVSFCFSVSKLFVNKVMSLILYVPRKQPNAHFSWRVTWLGDFSQFEEKTNLILSWYWLMLLVDTVTLSWHWTQWTAFSSLWHSPAGCHGMCWHWHLDTVTMYNCYYCQRQSNVIMIISSKATTLLLGSRAQSRMTKSLCLNSAGELYCQPLASQYRALQLV